MQQVISRKKQVRKFDWNIVDDKIRALYEDGLSPRAISLSLTKQGCGHYPWKNINVFVRKFRGTDSAIIRQKNLGQLSRASQVFDAKFVCAICKQPGDRTMWNSRFCLECRGKYSDRQLNRFKTYELHPDEFERMIQDQQDKCTLCDVTFNHGNSAAGLRNPCIDHCHSTGRIRGILCVKCNWALHMAEISGWIQKAEEYLKLIS